MLIIFFLFAVLLQGSFTVYRIFRERTELGGSDSGISNYVLPAVFALLLLFLSVCGGNMFEGVNKHTAAIGASFAGFLWLPRIAVEYFFLHMSHTKEELFMASIYVICSIIMIVKS